MTSSVSEATPLLAPSPILLESEVNQLEIDLEQGAHFNPTTRSVSHLEEEPLSHSSIISSREIPEIHIQPASSCEDRTGIWKRLCLTLGIKVPIWLIEFINRHSLIFICVFVGILIGLTLLLIYFGQFGWLVLIWKEVLCLLGFVNCSAGMVDAQD